MRVSVVVPVYNVAPYLRQCLDSLVGQTLKDIEIICVDDGSTDGSGAILDEYAEKDPRVKAIHQPNAGAGAARNAGLARATGEYLFFCDPDDWAESDMLERMYAKARAAKADVLLTGRVVEIGDGECIRVTLRKALEQFAGPFEGCALGDWLFRAVKPSLWDKLFRLDWIRRESVGFQAIRNHNDWFFTYSAVSSAVRIATLEGAFYHYRNNREGSLQSSKGSSEFFWFEAIDAIAMRWKAKGVYGTFATAHLDALLCFGIPAVLTFPADGAQDRLYPELRSRIKALVEENPGVGPLGEIAQRRLEIVLRNENPLALACELIRREQDARSRLKARVGKLQARNESLHGANVELRTKNDSLCTANGELRAKNGALQAKNDSLCTANGALQAKNDSLRTANGALRAKNAALGEANGMLRTKNAALGEANGTLREKNGALRERNGRLEDRVAAQKERVRALMERNEILRRRPDTIRTAIIFICKRFWARIWYNKRK